MWDVPVVLFCVWTLVLVVASLIVLACLQRETKKFRKRFQHGGSGREELVSDVSRLDSIMGRYVQQFLGQGILETLANSYANQKGDSKAEILRFVYIL